MATTANYTLNGTSPAETDFGWRVSQTEVVLESVFLTILVLTSVVGNGLMLTATGYSTKLRSPIHMLLTNMMVCSLAYAGISGTFTIYGCIAGSWHLPNELCSFVTFNNIITISCTIVTNAAIAFNRFLACHPQSTCLQKMATKKATAVMIGLLWLYAGCLSAPMLIELRSDFLLPYGTCGVSNDNPVHLLYMYIVVLGAVGVYTPLLVTVSIYVIILIRLVTRASSFPSAQHRRGIVKATRNTVLLFVFFCVCWLPDTLHNIFDIELAAPVWVTRVTSFLYYVNSAINPVFYVIGMEEYRHAVRRLLKIKDNTVHSFQVTANTSALQDRSRVNASGKNSKRVTVIHE